MCFLSISTHTKGLVSFEPNNYASWRFQTTGHQGIYNWLANRKQSTETGAQLIIFVYLARTPSFIALPDLDPQPIYPCICYSSTRFSYKALQSNPGRCNPAYAHSTFWYHFSISAILTAYVTSWRHFRLRCVTVNAQVSLKKHKLHSQET